MGRNLNATFIELRGTGQGGAKTALFEARAARHLAQRHAGPPGRNLTELNLSVLRVIMYAVGIVKYMKKNRQITKPRSL